MKPSLFYKLSEVEVETEYQVLGEETCDISCETEISATVICDYDEISESTLGVEVLQIRVLKDDKYVNFWVRVGTNRGGRVIAEIITNVANESKSKTLQAGAWRLDV